MKIFVFLKLALGYGILSTSKMSSRNKQMNVNIAERSKIKRATSTLGDVKVPVYIEEKEKSSKKS